MSRTTLYQGIDTSLSHTACTDFSLCLSLSFSLLLSIHLYHLSLPIGIQDYILCPHRPVVCKFLLVSGNWHVHDKVSIGERHLLVHPSFYSTVLHVLFVLFGFFKRWEVNGRKLLFRGGLLPGFIHIASSFFVQFLSSFFSQGFSVYMPYIRTMVTL